MPTVEDLFNCPGWQATNRTGILAEMYNVFFQNYLEFQSLVTRIHNENPISRETFKEYLDHLPQRIFNYLSSAIALADQTSRMMCFYEGTDVYTLYENKVAQVFAENKCAHFIKKLRNYQTHFQITYPDPVRSIDDNKSWDIVLRSDVLLKHPKEWDQVSKDFIKSCGVEINLNKIFSEYTNMVKAFHKWLYPILQQYHQKDFEDQKKLEQQLNISTDELKSKLSPFFQ